ncbi:MAG: YkgJ family cysteine cluster protein [Bacteroidota bacterium]|nr:YkgJ family cysteine cluster protein [Bacteroidota bacterium]
MDIVAFEKKAKNKFQDNKSFLKKLKRKKPNNLDDITKRFHDEAFEEIDCLECANCCKTTSPAFYQKDIERLSQKLKMSTKEFINTYLHLDDEKEYVLNESPCPFLGADNLCIVYDSRPKACREYPHTDHKRQYQILNKSINNTLVCPAVFIIVERLREYYKF